MTTKKPKAAAPKPVKATAKRAIACPACGGLLCDKAECLANGCKGRP